MFDVTNIATIASAADVKTSGGAQVRRLIDVTLLLISYDPYSDLVTF
jgi:hypothetical protein